MPPTRELPEVKVCSACFFVSFRIRRFWMRFQQFAFSYRGQQLWLPSGPRTHPIRGYITMRVGVTILGLSVLASTLGVSGQTQNQSGFPPGSTAPAAPTSRASTAAQREDHDPLLDLPRLPHKEVTLIGGTVISMDEVMNRMVVQPFAGKQKMRIRLDARTHFYRDGQQITEREIQKGQRIYLDTMLNGDKVFAKTIWIRTAVESGTSRGQIVEFDRQRTVLTVRDELSDQPVKMQLSPAIVV